MKRYLIFVLALIALAPLYSQSPPPQGGGGGGGESAGGIPEEKSKEPESVIQRKISDVPLTQGIRFTFKDIPGNCPKGLYLRLNKDKCILVTPIMGLAGARVPFPRTGMIEMYEKPIVNGEPQGKKIISIPLPAGLSTKVLGVIIPGQEEGQYNIFFVDEKQLNEGAIFIRNLTNERIGLQIGGDKVMDFTPGKSEIFAPSLSGDKKSNVYPAKMYRQDKEGKWYVTRQLALMCRPKIQEIVLIIWNSSIDKPDIMKIQIAPENYAPRKAANGNSGKESDSPEAGAGGGASAPSRPPRRERPPVGS